MCHFSRQEWNNSDNVLCSSITAQFGMKLNNGGDFNESYTTSGRLKLICSGWSPLKKHVKRQDKKRESKREKFKKKSVFSGATCFAPISMRKI